MTVAASVGHYVLRNTNCVLRHTSYVIRTAGQSPPGFSPTLLISEVAATGDRYHVSAVRVWWGSNRNDLMSHYPPNFATKIQLVASTERDFPVRQLVDRFAHQHV